MYERLRVQDPEGEMSKEGETDWQMHLFSLEVPLVITMKIFQSHF